jgi:hypothetical protein
MHPISVRRKAVELVVERGLIVSEHWPCLHDYPRWQFVNRSEEILGWCGDALDLVDVAWKRSHRRTISVSRRAAVQRLDELVGPKA